MRHEAEAFDLKAALREELAAARLALVTLAGAPAVHRCRVSLKRARTLARIGADGAPGLAKVFNERARALMADLSAARDLAALGVCARAESRKASGAAAAALKRIALALTGAADAAGLPEAEASLQRLSELEALAEVWPEPSPQQLARGLRRIVRRAHRAAERARGRRKPSLRHRWRKREKDRLYAALLVGPAWPDKTKRRRGRAQKLTRALGGERELLLLMDKIEREPNLAGGKRPRAAALRALSDTHRLRAKKADRLGKLVHRGGH